jgi:hypothetical protein
MIQHRGKRSPPHHLTEFDHPTRKPVTCLRQILHSAAGDFVFASDGVDWHFVTEIAELERGVETFVDAGDFDFARGGFFHCGAIGPESS